MWQFSITYNSITTIISEPIGWNETEIVVKRNKEFHGIFFEYSLNKLRYHGTAFGILKGAYETYGIDAEAELLIEYKCDDSDTFEEFYTGKFAFNQIKIEEGNGCFIEIPIEQIGCVNTFLNRKDQKVNLNSNEDFDGNALTPYTGLNEVLAFPPKEILLQTEFEQPANLNISKTKPIGLTNYIFTLGFDNVNLDEIETSYNVPFELEGNAQDLKDNEFGLIDITPISSIRCIGTDYNFDINLQGDFVEFSADATRIYTANLVLLISDRNGNTKFSTVLQSLGGSFSQGIANNQTINVNYQTVQGLDVGDRIYLYLFVAMNFTATPGGGSASFTIDTDFTSGHFKANTLSLCETTASKVAYINEALSRTVEAITNDCIRVRSDYYGRTNSQPYSREIDGCGGLRVITDGLNIRKKLLSDGTVPPITVSFDDMINGLDPIDNIGYGIENDPSRAGFKQLRVEPFEYFYNFSTSLTLKGISQIETSVDESRIYSQINIGYNKWESEEFNGLDEINTSRTYRTILNSVKNTLTKVSGFIASGYALEITRRKGTNSNDWRFDKDIFIVQLRRRGIAVFVEFFNNTQLLFQNLITPFTTYNIRISPIRNLLRWFPIIQASWSKQATTPIELKFTDGTANYKAETQILINGCLPEVNNFLLSESRNVSKNDLLGVTPDPIFEPELIKFDFPLSYQQFNIIRQQPYNKIKIIGNFGETSGWIDTINYKPNTGIASFTLLKQYGI
jgi:hypothetical protein